MAEGTNGWDVPGDEQFVIPAGQRAVIVYVEEGRATRAVMRGVEKSAAFLCLLTAADTLADEAVAAVAAKVGIGREPVPEATVGPGEARDG